MPVGVGEDTQLITCAGTDTGTQTVSPRTAHTVSTPENVLDQLLRLARHCVRSHSSHKAVTTVGSRILPGMMCFTAECARCGCVCCSSRTSLRQNGVCCFVLNMHQDKAFLCQHSRYVCQPPPSDTGWGTLIGPSVGTGPSSRHIPSGTPSSPHHSHPLTPSQRTGTPSGRSRTTSGVPQRCYSHPAGRDPCWVRWLRPACWPPPTLITAGAAGAAACAALCAAGAAAAG